MALVVMSPLTLFTEKVHPKNDLLRRETGVGYAWGRLAHEPINHDRSEKSDRFREILNTWQTSLEEPGNAGGERQKITKAVWL
jgi:hypothetical protein